MKPCGTNAAYNRHIVNKTPVCEPCKQAHAEYRAKHRQRVYLNRGNLMQDATGTVRRIRALMRMGYRGEDIAEVAVPGMKSGAKWVYAVLDQTQVYPSTYWAIRNAYEALSHIPGPSPYARRQALKKNWAPPMAWDDIDDPECKPQGYLRASEYKKLKGGIQ